MNNQLRPMTLGEILDRTAELYRTHFLLFAGISAIFAVIMLLMQMLYLGWLVLLGYPQIPAAPGNGLTASLGARFWPLRCWPGSRSPPTTGQWPGSTWTSPRRFVAPPEASFRACAATFGS